MQSAKNGLERWNAVFGGGRIFAELEEAARSAVGRQLLNGAARIVLLACRYVGASSLDQVS